MKHNLAKQIVVLIICMLMIVPMFSMSAMADNVCGQISGSSEAEKTFKVYTGSRWYSSKDVLKLTQEKGTMKIWHLLDKTDSYDTKKMYEIYTVKVEKISNNKVVKTKTYEWKTSTLKIKLDKNATYHVTVTSCWVRRNGEYIGGTLANPYGGFSGITWMPVEWTEHSTWKVSATKGILSCDD